MRDTIEAGLQHTDSYAYFFKGAPWMKWGSGRM